MASASTTQYHEVPRASAQPRVTSLDLLQHAPTVARSCRAYPAAPSSTRRPRARARAHSQPHPSAGAGCNMQHATCDIQRTGERSGPNAVVSRGSPSPGADVAACQPTVSVVSMGLLHDVRFEGTVRAGARWKVRIERLGPCSRTSGAVEGIVQHCQQEVVDSTANRHRVSENLLTKKQNRR